MENDSTYEKFINAFWEKNAAEDKKKGVEEKTLKKGLGIFKSCSGINLDCETYDLLKKSLANARKEDKIELDLAKADLDQCTQILNNSVPGLIHLMTEKNGKYSVSFPNIGSVSYTPSSPYQMVSSLDKVALIESILEMPNWDELLDINKEAYLKANERYVAKQKEQGKKAIELLPFVVKRVNVDKKDVKITRSRKKSS